ncbi:MAG: hypothetical protein MJE77_36600 [Proteobacteria bacterium]|nr:hypothetical protein [Pseudomonadota bacterium]
MDERQTRIFDDLRTDILTRLVEVRGGIDPAYEKIPDLVIREHFNIVLDKLRAFLATGENGSYRRFASRYMAIRVAEGFGAENLIHTIVAIGDIVAQVARARLDPSPDRESFVRAVMRMNFVNARMLVAFLAEDLAERVAQRELLLRSVR